MEVRQALLEEISEIMKIYEAARCFMAEHGNPTQWVNGYPSEELVTEDCKNGELYVCVLCLPKSRILHTEKSFRENG